MGTRGKFSLSGAQAFALDLLVSSGRCVNHHGTWRNLLRRGLVEYTLKDNVSIYVITVDGLEALKRYGESDPDSHWNIPKEVSSAEPVREDS